MHSCSQEPGWRHHWRESPRGFRMEFIIPFLHSSYPAELNTFPSKVSHRPLVFKIGQHHYGTVLLSLQETTPLYFTGIRRQLYSVWNLIPSTPPTSGILIMKLHGLRKEGLFHFKFEKNTSSRQCCSTQACTLTFWTPVKENEINSEDLNCYKLEQ